MRMPVLTEKKTLGGEGSTKVNSETQRGLNYSSQSDLEKGEERTREKRQNDCGVRVPKNSVQLRK